MDIITSHLDYLTRSYNSAQLPKDLFPLIPGFKVKKKIGRVRQYEQGYELECGGYLLLNGADNPQGSLLDLTGEPLFNLRMKYDLSDEIILMHTSNTEQFKRTTRIDYCWNVPGEKVTQFDTLREWNEDRVKSRIRCEPRITGKNNKAEKGVSAKETTIYYGSETSDVQVRVYDKAGQMKLLAQALTRVEIQLRNEHARLLSIDASKSTIKVAAQTKLKKVLDFPALEWWQRMFTDEVCELSPIKPRDKNALGFLTRTIDPFIQSNIEDYDFAATLSHLMSHWAALAYATLEPNESED